MPDTFIPPREAELVTWSNNFDTLINVSPVAYGLTSAQTLTFTGLQNAFVSAYQIANDNLTRSPANIVTKNDAKDVMVDNARDLVGIVQNFPGTTDTQRSALGITVPDLEPTPVPVPKDPPQLDIESRFAKTVSIRLHDRFNPTKRGKPDGVSGATIMSFVGAAPPADIGDWKFEGSTTRTSYDVEFPVTLSPGTQVWLTAFWFNTKSESGPASVPTETWLDSGLSAAA